MNKLLYSTFFLLCLATFANGQTRYHIAPNPASSSATVDVTDAPVDAEIVNLTSDTLRLHWVRNVISLTPGCQTAVCDAITCYARSVSSHDFKLFPNVTKPFLVHFYNNDAPCAGIVHVKVTNNNDAADSVNVVFLFNQSSGTVDLPAANVKLYPNPVTEYFSLENAENVAAIRVFTLDGREVLRFDANSSNVYSLVGQPAGNYVMALEDKNGQPFQALELKKQ